MNLNPDATLRTARGIQFSQLSSYSEVIVHLEQLHGLVLSVCPECLLQKRQDDGLIYVPPQRQYAKTDKNLLTMWADGARVRMRIMFPKPSPEEEYFDNSKLDEYLGRLKKLYDHLLRRS